MDKALEQFLAVADSGSLVAASEQLMVTQPTLSYGLKKLETQLGVRLFDRTPRGVRLTRYGETLYKNTQMMRRLYENALQAIERQRAAEEEGISIGTGYSTWILFLKDFVIERLNIKEQVPINVNIGNTMRCMEQLWTGDIALSVGHLIPDLVQEIEVDFIPLGQVRDSYFVREGHPLLSSTRTLQEIRAYPTTMAFPPDTRQRRLITGNQPEYSEEATRHYHGIGSTFSSNSLEACLEITKYTNTVLIHSRLLTHYFQEQGLHEVEMNKQEAFVKNTLGIYTLRDRPQNAYRDDLINIIKDRGKTLNFDPI